MVRSNGVLRISRNERKQIKLRIVAAQITRQNKAFLFTDGNVVHANLPEMRGI